MLKILFTKLFKFFGKEDQESPSNIGEMLYDSMKRGDWGTEE